MVSEGEQCDVTYVWGEGIEKILRDFGWQDPAAHGEPLFLDVCTELKEF